MKPLRMKVYTLTETQEILRVSEPTLREFIKSGALPVLRVGPRTIRVPESSLAALLPAPPSKHRSRRAVEVADRA